MLTGSYAVCYFRALDSGITAGLLATLLGTQPLLTLLSPSAITVMAAILGGVALVFGSGRRQR